MTQEAHEAGAARIELVLVSHTNVGKTTLARTLLGQDVGEVRDAAHVTLTADPHRLLTTAEGDELVLWDTPGLGDSARLYQRLSRASNPIVWFLSQVWDRWTDRAFFLSQEAMRATRDHADLLLYPVNATEAPADAGYLEPELKLLAWMDKPVLVLLNQTGLAGAGSDMGQAELRRWQQHLQGAPAVRGVLPLDAFTRCWVHEQALFDALGAQLPPAKQPGFRRLQRDWQRRNVERFRASMSAIAAQLAAATPMEQVVEPGTANHGKVLARLAGSDAEARRERSQQALQRQVKQGREDTTRELLRLHGLLGRAEDPFLKGLDRSDLVARAPLDRVRAGLGGAIASGAASGLAADAAAGGLTLGAGALLGALAGAVAFVAGAEGLNRARGLKDERLRLSDAALRGLLQEALLKYLAVAHFGRGRGEFEHDRLPEAWVEQARSRVEGAAAELDAVFAAQRLGDLDTETARAQLEGLATRLALELLEWLYPEAALDGLAPLADAGAAAQ
ncbi:GTPase domain-containing protein [uncultured Azohydromonas sp.]|uniref:GTPase domain-containing protein n=1 Tax=uncultured Azohydromonas sp. TaxID=487342 RepID=UPI002620A677|nr:GTPase domain-containing protein [uncultured Azohydromonas sp.]